MTAWEKFLDDVIPDPRAQEFIQRAMGAALLQNRASNGSRNEGASFGPGDDAAFFTPETR